MRRVRQPPGAGFNTDPASAAIVPLPGRITGTGSVLASTPAQTTRSSINRAWKRGDGAGSAGRVGTPIHYTIRGLSNTAQDELVQSLSLQAQRAESAPGRRASTAHRPLQPWTAAWTKAWSAGCRAVRGFTTIRVHPEDFKSPLAQKIDVLIMADECAVPAPGSGGPRRARRSAVAVRPEYAYQLTRANLQGFEQFVRGGGYRRLH